MSLCNKITNSMCQVLQGYKEATYFEITFNFSKGVQSPRLSPLYFQIGYRTLKGSQSINDLSNFPDGSVANTSGGASGGSGGPLPRSSRGKEGDQVQDTQQTPQLANITRNRNRKQVRPRPQSLYVCALENCMTEGDGEVIVAEALISGSEKAVIVLSALLLLHSHQQIVFLLWVLIF